MAVSGTGQGETPQSLATPAFAGFPPIAESGTKAALTTGMTTDRKNFDFPSRRGIMAEIEYPGIAKLVSRLVWDQETVRSSRTTRTKSPLKSLVSEGFSYSLSIAAQGVSKLFFNNKFYVPICFSIRIIPALKHGTIYDGKHRRSIMNLTPITVFALRGVQIMIDKTIFTVYSGH